MKLVVWGIGGHWEKIRRILDFQKIEIVLFVDSNSKRTCILIEEKEVLVTKPKELLKYEYDYVLIASTYIKEIETQLKMIGVPEHKIIANIFEDGLGYKFLDEKKMMVQVMSNAETGSRRIVELEEKIDLTLTQNGKILGTLLGEKKNINTLSEVGFKVFSQWDEDGIIQWLISQVPIKNKTFIEFGVENYTEANTRFLLINNNWSGMIIDGNERSINQVRTSSIMWRYDLKPIAAFITRENINELLLQSGFEKDLGLLSIDIDGNDYWILKKIEVMQPRILILEYNHIWGEKKAVSIPYKANFVRNETHYSNLYFGMSFQAAKSLAEEKGFVYIGSNCQYNNAFFVRKDLAHYIDFDNMDRKWKSSKFRESRDENGNLTYLSREEGLRLIKNLEIVDLESDKLITIAELYGLK